MNIILLKVIIIITTQKIHFKQKTLASLKKAILYILIYKKMFDLQDFEVKVVEEIQELEDLLNEKEKNLEYIFSNEFFKTLEEIKFLKKVLQKI
jgi:hypothetical protein